MKLKKGARVKIVHYGHQVISKKGDKKDLMPQLVGKHGVITQVTHSGYMIKFDKEKETTGWFEDNQTEEIK